MNRLSEWFIENKLLLNFKPGRTNLLVFGTNQQLTKIPKNLEITYNHQVIMVLSLKGSLKIKLPRSLNLNS